MLPLDQCVQTVGVRVERAHGLQHRIGHVRPLGREPGQLGLEVVRSPHHVWPMAGQACECVPQSLQFRMRVTEDAVVSRAGRSAACASRRPTPRMIRRPTSKPQLEPALLQHLAVLFAEKGSEQLALQIAGTGLPIDVEIAGARRIRSPLQDVEPPCVIGPAHAHMVRHEVENLAKTVRLQRVDHRSEVVLAAEFGVERVVVHDVVAMRASRPRLQVGRRVEMTDPKCGEIRHEPGGLRESEILRQLQTIRGARNGCFGISGHRGTCGWSEADERC